MLLPPHPRSASARDCVKSPKIGDCGIFHLTENAASIFTSAHIYGEEDSVIAELIRVANESTDASMRRKAAFFLSGFLSYPGVDQEISEVYRRDGFPVAAIGTGPEWLPWLLIIVILGVIIGCVYVLFALIL